MNLSNVSTQALVAELRDRERQEEFDRWNNIPDNVLPYSEIDNPFGIHHRWKYKVDVYDGAEGFSYLLASNESLEEEEIHDIVKHHVLTSAKTGGYHILIEGIGDADDCFYMKVLKVTT